ncbi:MAG TPA: hypothetical protein VKA65_05615, partial [Acidimicrobiales bacterium]|nr:hypothetical protein [Acidimicrobiales bacterium]
AVFESFLYLISNGALDWGPIRRLRHSDMVNPERTVATTVRKVGLEGRLDEPGQPGRPSPEPTGEPSEEPAREEVPA